VSEDVPMSNEQRPAPHRPRGWVSLYAVAFLLQSTRLLWTSTALSGLAILVAIVSVALPRR